jgi:Glycosyltransferases involved in cell wall biogenesis
MSTGYEQELEPASASISVKPAHLPDISLIIPVYNEAASITPLINEVVRILSGKIRYEIITVDDGSTDETAGILVRMVNDSNYPLRVIRHAANYGQSAAIHTGIQAARAAWVVTMDGDGQNNPEDILKLVETRNNSSIPDLKLISGYRKKRQDNLIKIISSRIANFVRGRILQDMTPDTGCGLKLIHRITFLNLPFFDHMHRFIPALVRRAGGNILSVEVSHRPRKAGQSKYNINNRLWVGIIDLLGMLWLIRRAKNPVKEEVTRYDD